MLMMHLLACYHIPHSTHYTYHASTTLLARHGPDARATASSMQQEQLESAAVHTHSIYAPIIMQKCSIPIRTGPTRLARRAGRGSPP